MAPTQIDLDDEALAMTMKLSGTRTKKDAVNLALREYAARQARIEALERSARAGADWDYDGWLELRTQDRRPQ